PPSSTLFPYTTLFRSTDTHLHIGACAVVRVTGIRNPCVQLDRFQSALTAAVLARSADGQLIRKAGIMGVVVAGGRVAPGDPILRSEEHTSELQSRSDL